MSLELGELDSALGSWRLRAPAQKGLELLRELWELDSELRELDSELRELKIQTSRSWKSKAQGALLGAGLEEAIEQKVSLIPGSLGEAKKKRFATKSRIQGRPKHDGYRRLVARSDAQ